MKNGVRFATLLSIFHLVQPKGDTEISFQVPQIVTDRLKTHEFGQRRPALTSPHRHRRFPQTKPI
jgi:hypothetical protein